MSSAFVPDLIDVEQELFEMPQKVTTLAFIVDLEE